MLNSSFLEWNKECVKSVVRTHAVSTYGQSPYAKNAAIGEFIHKHIQNLQCIGNDGLADTESSFCLSKKNHSVAFLSLVDAGEVLLEACRVHQITKAEPNKQMYCLFSENSYFSCALQMCHAVTSTQLFCLLRFLLLELLIVGHFFSHVTKHMETCNRNIGVLLKYKCKHEKKCGEVRLKIVSFTDDEEHCSQQ